MALNKTERLKREQFTQFFKQGTRTHSKYATMVHHPADTLHASVVVSKKVAKQAVTRNKLRRRVYNLIRSEIKNQNKTGVYIMVLKPSIQELTTKEQGEQIKTIIGQTTSTT